MSGSPSERAIRYYAAQRLREMLPSARIIHELVVGGCRADLAAVERERITLVEIKSEKDTLKRLPEQVRQFERASHSVIIVAHERWFDTTPHFAPGPELAEHSGIHNLWAYPEDHNRQNYNRWVLSPYLGWKPEPHAARLLELLWKSELLAEAARHRISASSRSTVISLIHDMAWHMTGAEIARAVCRQLRNRPFPEADAPISERLAA